MHVHPAIARLRGEGAPQPQAQALAERALAAWRARPKVAGVIAALGDYGAGAGLADCRALAALLADQEAALELVTDLAERLIAAQRASPLAPLPLAHAAQASLARLRLAESGRAALRLAVFAPCASVQPASVLFEDGEAHELVLAGSGEAARYWQEGATLACSRLACAPGTRISRAGPGDARQVLGVTRPLLVLQLTREAIAPVPAREVAWPSGALLKTISASKRASQQMMALAVLGALAHRPAAAAMADLACDRSAERDLRWESLRQLLALDARAGMALLAKLAAPGGEDALAAPAALLRHNLLAVQPELALLEPA